MAKAALLFAEKARTSRRETWNQKEICARLGISETTLSRVLRDAREDQWLELLTTVARKRIPPEILATAELQLKATAAPAEAVSDGIRVLPGEDQEAFLLSVAEYLVGQFAERSRRIGLMFGRTLHQLGERICEVLKEGRDLRGRVSFVPLVGDPLFAMHLGEERITASSIAGMLHHAVYGPSEKVEAPTLTGLPAYIGSSTRSDVPPYGMPEAICQFVKGTPGYGRIFLGTNTEPAAVLNLDTAISGVGVVDAGHQARTGVFLREVMLQERLSFAEMDRMIAGDMTGIVLPRRELDSQDASKVARINGGWTGVQRPHLEIISRNAKQSGGLGVVVIAFEVRKLEVLRRIHEEKLADELLVSEAIGKAWNRTQPSGPRSAE